MIKNYKHVYKKKVTSAIDLASEDGMPASDAPSWTLGVVESLVSSEERCANPVVEVLSYEHCLIGRVMEVMALAVDKIEAGQKIDMTDIKSIHSFLKEFIDECHHKKEDILFPYMQGKDESPSDYILTDLKEEHQHSEKMHKDLALYLEQDEVAQLEKISDLVVMIKDMLSLYKNHVAKEEEYILTAIKDTVDKKTQKTILEKFKKIDEDQGPNKHVQLIHLAEQLSHKIR